MKISSAKLNDRLAVYANDYTGINARVHIQILEAPNYGPFEGFMTSLRIDEAEKLAEYLQKAIDKAKINAAKK